MNKPFLPAFPNFFKGKRNESAILNHNTFNDYYLRLQEYVINMFEWNGLPDTVDPRYIELMLCQRGYIVYFNDEVLGDLALQCTIGAPLDVYRIPIYRRAFAENGYSKELNQTNSVLIFNNYLHTPSLLTIELYARRLAEIERAIDVNVKAQKTPVILAGSDTQQLTLKNVYKDYDQNMPFITVDKGLDLSQITSFKTDIPYVANDLNILKRQIWQEALTFCGVDNMNTEKRERLVTDEILSNLGSVQAQRYVMLNSRREAAEKINKMFGTDITVDFRQDISIYNILNETTTTSGDDSLFNETDEDGDDNG